MKLLSFLRGILGRPRGGPVPPAQQPKAGPDKAAAPAKKKAKRRGVPGAFGGCTRAARKAKKRKAVE